MNKIDRDALRAAAEKATPGMASAMTSGQIAEAVAAHVALRDMMHPAAVLALLDENERMREQLSAANAMRPHWAQGYTSDGIAAQVNAAALSQVWRAIGANNQTECMEKLRAALEPGA